jgi:hypothetical protein
MGSVQPLHQPMPVRPQLCRSRGVGALRIPPCPEQLRSPHSAPSQRGIPGPLAEVARNLWVQPHSAPSQRGVRASSSSSTGPLALGRTRLHSQRGVRGPTAERRISPTVALLVQHKESGLPRAVGCARRSPLARAAPGGGATHSQSATSSGPGDSSITSPLATSNAIPTASSLYRSRSRSNAHGARGR